MAFGGVSLNKTANLMLNIQDIGGAKFDPATGQVILYGKKNVGLPQMKLDDLSVAVSSVYGLHKAAQDPGVSIGTEASDVPGQMKVRYDGDTANTAFGVTMFDSDRLLKTLSMGKDNITGASVSSSVSGYQNMLDRYRAGGTQGYLAAAGNPTNRMWFTPQEVKLVLSADLDAMLFDSVKMQLLTESAKNGVVGSDPFAEAFATHFTANYDAFAAERPVLQELKRLGKMTAVVKWIKDNDIPFDLSFFKSYTPEVHTTPAYTPQTSVSTSWREGLMFYTLTITGGVVYKLDASNFSSTTGSSAAAAGDAAVNSRPSEGSFSWDFSANGQAYTAIAQSFTRSQKDGSVRGSTTDMAFPVTGDVPLAFVRYYDSFYDNSTGFGYGWQVTPFAVRFPDDIRSFTFNSSQISVNAHYQLYLRAGQGEFLYRLVGLDANNKAIYLREGGSDILKDMGDGTYVLDMRNKGKVSFDSTGRVTRITDKNDIAITYNYSANGLSSIVHQGGRTITLNYTSGKITSVTGPGSKTVAYAYDANAQLNTVTDELSHTTTYYYDADKHINKIDDPKGNHAYQAAYDDYNRATSQTMGGANYASEFDLTSRMTTLTDPNNTKSTQIFDADYKLSQSQDYLNNKVNIEYDPLGFGPSKVTDAQGNVTQYKYDSNGNVWYAKDAQGHQTFLFYDPRNNLVAKRDAKGYDMAFIYDTNDRLVETRLLVLLDYTTPADPVDVPANLSYSYDPSYIIKYSYHSGTGKLLSVTDAQGRTVVTTYDVNGLPVTVTAPGGYKTTNTYDDRSRLTSVTNTAGETSTFEYDAADRIKKVTTAYGTAIASSVQYAYDNNGNVATITDGKGYVTQYGYDSNNNLTTVTDAETGLTTYAYDITNKLTSIVLANGATKEIAYDESNRPIMEINRRANPKPRIAVTPLSINFGSVPAGTPVQKQITVYNVGDAALNITNVSSNNSVFTVSPQSGTVTAGGNLVLNVTLTSLAMGASTGKLTITSNDTRSSSIDINLSGDVTLSTLSGSVTSELNGLRVSWNQYQGQGTFAQYKVYRSMSAITDLSTLTPIWISTSVGAFNYLDATTVVGSAYYYAVAAFDAGGNRLTGGESIGPVNFLNIGKLGTAINAAVSANNEYAVAQVYNSTVQEYLLVYEKDVSGNGTNTDIYGQRVSAAGALVGSAFAIFSSGNNEKMPQVAWNSTRNEYMVICAYDSNGSGLYQVKAQRLSSAGALVGDVVSVYSSSNAQRSPAIVYNSTENTYLIVFCSDFTRDGVDDLVRFLLDADGNALSGKYNAYTYAIQNPRVAFNTQTNEYMVVSEYTDNVSVAKLGMFKLDSAATALTGQLLGVTQKVTLPSIVYNSARNEYLSVFQYDYLGTGVYGTYVVKINAAGSSLSSINISSTGNSLLWPSVVFFATKGEYFITVTNSAASGSEYNVQTLRILDSTLTQLTTQTMSVASESGKEERKSVVSFNAASNEFLVSYEYNNGTNYDIRSQRVGAVTQTARFTPVNFDFGSTTILQTLQVDGIAGAPFSSFTGSQDQPWIGVSYTSLSLGGANPYVTMRISVNRAGLGVGTYTGNVVIRCDGITTLIPVTMQVTNLAPNVPTNPTPVTGATGQAILGTPLRVATTWLGSDPQGDALTYDVYLSDNQTLVANADQSVLVAPNQVTASYTSSALGHNRTYYWRVKAKDSAGLTALGDVWQFGTEGIATPVLIAQNPDPTNFHRPTLRWGDVDGASRYHVQIANNPNFTSPIVDVSNVTAAAYTPASNLPEGTIFWRVSAIDVQGGEGSYATPGSFVIDITPPAKVLLTAYAPDPTTTKKPTLSWAAVSDASLYHIQISTAANFSSTLFDGYISGTSYTLVTDLPEGTIYWRVSAKDIAGNEGSYSDTDNFSVDTTPPEQVALATPVAGFTNIQLSWTAIVDTQGDFKNFNIYRSETALTNVSGLTPVDQSLTNKLATSFTDTTAVMGQNYYYAVTAVDLLGNENKQVSAMGPVSLAKAPVLLMATSGDTQVLLSWEAVGGAASYSIKYGTTAGVYGAPVAVGNVTSYTITGLTNATPYFFIVTATTSAGTSGNSNEMTATPQLLPPVETILNTATAGDAQVTLNWGAISNAASYSIRYGTAAGVFGAPIIVGDVTSYTVTGLTNETMYYFVVAAVNAAGTSGNSNEMAVIPKKPIALVEYTPDPTNDQKPVLSWLSVAGAATYHVQISASNLFGTTLVDQYVAATNYTPATNLPEGMIYWRVSAKDTLGNEEAFSAADSFRIDITPPGAMTLTAMDGRFQDVKITWQAFVDSQGDFTHFNIYRSASSFSDVSSMTPIDQSLTNMTATSFIDPAAVEGQKYYYAVTAGDTPGNENKSVVVIGPVGRAQAPALNPTPTITNVTSITLAGSKSAFTSILINNVEVIPLGVEETWSVNYILSEGANTLVVKARDSVGTESSLITRPIQLDTHAPVIAIESPVDHSGVSGTMVDVLGTIDDPAATVVIEVTGADTHTFPGTNNGDGTFLATGVSIEGAGQSNTIKAKATDAASNTSESSVTVMQGWMMHMDVPYAATTTYYSGAASTQMVSNFIRNGLKDHLTQQEVYNYGHPYNLTANTALLEMDPNAISYALGHFDPYDLADTTGFGDGYSAYNFGAESFESTKFTEYLRDIMHWMAYPVKQGYWWAEGPLTKWPNVPAVVPMYGTYGHWVVVNGAAASENPMPEPYTNPWNTPNFTAYGLWLTDPATGGIGKDLYVTAQSAQDTFLFPVTTTDRYNGKYVQVAEPPNVESKAKVEIAPAKVNEQTQELVRISGEISQDVPDKLSEVQKRQENAKKHLYDAALVVNLKMDTRSKRKDLSADKNSLNSVFKLNQSQATLDWRKVIDSSLFANDDFVKAFDGSQAREFIKVRRSNQENSFYYLVPFDKYVKGQFLTYAAVILDAEDGSFKEATWVKAPVRFIQITSERALELVSVEDPEFKIADAVIELVWQPGGYSQSPFYPYWKVFSGDKIYFATQDGKVIKNEKN